MIECITWDNAHLYGHALASQYRLRYRVFVAGQGWDVPHVNDMEYDQYDTPAATYLVWRDHQDEVRGLVRLSPTSRPYMIHDIWPGLVDKIALPVSGHVWEGTRLAVDPSLPPQSRRRIRNEILLGIIEFGLSAGIRQVIHLTPHLLVRSVFLRYGYQTEMVGPVGEIDGSPTVVCLSEMSQEARGAVQAATGISDPVLAPIPELRAGGRAA